MLNYSGSKLALFDKTVRLLHGLNREMFGNLISIQSAKEQPIYLVIIKEYKINIIKCLDTFISSRLQYKSGKLYVEIERRRVT